MLNLASLSALLRTLRQAGDGAAGPVERIAHVRRPASEGETQLQAETTWRDRTRGVPLPLRLQDDMPVPRRAADRAAAHIALREAAGGTARGMPGMAARTEEADGPGTSLALTRGGALVAAALSTQASSAPLRAHVEAAHPLVAHDRAPASELSGALARSVTDSG
ncbi:MAG TPA: hypothetical protein VFX05_10515, partial [Casimicrobiaceae bacterium]|nr:hypothetical protein [Casimicrobiaceae bacterium]